MHPHIDQTGNTSPRAIRVNRGKNQVPGQRTANRHLCRVGIPNLPQHNHVRVLPQECPQGTRERQTDLLLQLHLINPLQRVLHGVLYRENITRYIVQQTKCSVQRGTFPRPSGTTDQHQPVRVTNRRQVRLQLFTAKSQVSQFQQLHLPRQQTHHHLLPVDRRQRRNPHVKPIPARIMQNTPVLRQSLFRNIQIGKDLHLIH